MLIESVFDEINGAAEGKPPPPHKLAFLFVSVYECVCLHASWKKLFRFLFHATLLWFMHDVLSLQSNAKSL